tara:strand:- start:457 stop:1545 length:1089 start_codon:yes stop_codon:yes gene_type:complete
MSSQNHLFLPLEDYEKVDARSTDLENEFSEKWEICRNLVQRRREEDNEEEEEEEEEGTGRLEDPIDVGLGMSIVNIHEERGEIRAALRKVQKEYWCRDRKLSERLSCRSSGQKYQKNLIRGEDDDGEEENEKEEEEEEEVVGDSSRMNIMPRIFQQLRSGEKQRASSERGNNYKYGSVVREGRRRKSGDGEEAADSSRQTQLARERDILVQWGVESIEAVLIHYARNIPNQGIRNLLRILLPIELGMHDIGAVELYQGTHHAHDGFDMEKRDQFEKENRRNGYGDEENRWDESEGDVFKDGERDRDGDLQFPREVRSSGKRGWTRIQTNAEGRETKQRSANQKANAIMKRVRSELSRSQVEE